MNIKHIQILEKCILSKDCPNLILYSNKDINKINILFKLLNINNLNNYDFQNNMKIKLHQKPRTHLKCGTQDMYKGVCSAISIYK